MVLHLPKVRRQFAEFLQYTYLIALVHLHQFTCVGLGYGYIYIYMLFPGERFVFIKNPIINKNRTIPVTYSIPISIWY
jgi:hypothetical protein